MSTNRLIKEKSPYLLQHARNPVDWYPWSKEAFAAARAENKPIFLSVGYATCHWCHVMERESFEDEEAARYLNETFICIKVDREERPDIDSVYMRACQLLHGNGGWPLTIIMTPEKKPFFAGTYLPKRSRFGRMGVIDLCRRVKSLWTDENEKIKASAESITGSLARTFNFSPAADLDVSVLDRAFTQIGQRFDEQFGGFDSAPKFPTPHRLLFLLRCYHRTQNAQALDMVVKTLKAMRLGGIWDHVGFGFHRYSTDKHWLLPHFEKMLYDQGLLALAYLETYQITKEAFFARTADEIFTYVLRDMTSAEGAFYSAEDADSEGEEGKFYVWEMEEFRRVLGEAEAEPWCRIFNLSPAGNFLEEASGNKTGANILHLKAPLEHWAAQPGLGGDEIDSRWESARRKLYQVREKRVHPLKDDKILTDWNGLMIAALALGSVVLGKAAYAEAAEKAARFILKRMSDEQGRLMHRFREAETAIAAHADDYAFLIFGLLYLYRATFNPAYLKKAIQLQERMVKDYWDDREGGFFLSAAAGDELPLRPKELYDGAIPSANSVSFFNLVSLSRLTGDVKWEHKAAELSRAFAGSVSQSPTAYTFFLLGLELARGRGREVVVVGEPDSPITRQMLTVLNGIFLPHAVVLLKSKQFDPELSEVAKFTGALASRQEVPAVYVCSNFSCRQPVSDARALKDLLSD